jgi:hypothetical protein
MIDYASDSWSGATCCTGYRVPFHKDQQFVLMLRAASSWMIRNFGGYNFLFRRLTGFRLLAQICRTRNARRRSILRNKLDSSCCHRTCPPSGGNVIASKVGRCPNTAGSRIVRECQTRTVLLRVSELNLPSATALTEKRSTDICPQFCNSWCRCCALYNETSSCASSCNAE